MSATKTIFLFSVIAVLGGCGGGQIAQIEETQCGTSESCMNDPACECWCSRICNFRKKNSTDKPVYTDNDTNGKFCYCKQWDKDNYQKNCVMGKQNKMQKNNQ